MIFKRLTEPNHFVRALVNAEVLIGLFLIKIGLTFEIDFTVFISMPAEML